MNLSVFSIFLLGIFGLKPMWAWSNAPTITSSAIKLSHIPLGIFESLTSGGHGTYPTLTSRGFRKEDCIKVNLPYSANIQVIPTPNTSLPKLYLDTYISNKNVRFEYIHHDLTSPYDPNTTDSMDFKLDSSITNRGLGDNVRKATAIRLLSGRVLSIGSHATLKYGSNVALPSSSMSIQSNVNVKLPDSSGLTSFFIDTAAPKVQRIELTSTGSGENGVYVSGDKLDFKVTFDEPVFHTNKRTLSLPTQGCDGGTTCADSGTITGSTADDNICDEDSTRGTWAHGADGGGLTFQFQIRKSGGTETQTIQHVKPTGNKLIDNEIIFSYTIGPGDGTGTISLQKPLAGNEKSIYDLAGNPVDSRSLNKRLSGTTPKIRATPSSIKPRNGIRIRNSPESGNEWVRGERIIIDVYFVNGSNQPQKVKVTSGSTPSLYLNIGGATVSADYDPGYDENDEDDILTFVYKVLSSDEDTDGISIESNPISGTGGIQAVPSGKVNILYDYESIDLRTTVDGEKFIISIDDITLTSYPEGVVGNDYSYFKGETIEVDVQFSEDVQVVGSPKLKLSFGDDKNPTVVREAVYESTNDSYDGDNIVPFKYVVQRADVDTDGIAIFIGSGRRKNEVLIFDANNKIVDSIDQDGDGQVDGTVEAKKTYSGTFLNPADHKVDGRRPDVNVTDISITSNPSESKYLRGQKILIRLTLNEAVRVAGTPTLEITVGTQKRLAVYSPVDDLSDTDEYVTFAYTITAQDSDRNGISIGANSLKCTGDASISAISGNIGVGDSGQCSLSVPGSLSANQTSHQVDGAKVPVDGVGGNLISSLYISSNPYRANKPYAKDEIILIVISYTSPVIVIGHPILYIQVGDEKREATYLMPSTVSYDDDPVPSNNLTFFYKIQTDDTDTDGISIPLVVDSDNDGTHDSAFEIFTTIDNITTPLTDGTKVLASQTHVALTDAITHTVDHTHDVAGDKVDSFFMENPNAHSGNTKSGISLLSGWACRADEVEVEFEGIDGSVPLLYGSNRSDTKAVCNDEDNGFVATFNYNLLPAGPNTLILYIDDREKTRVDFTVVKPFSTDFQTGESGEGHIDLSNKVRAFVEWVTGIQGFDVFGFDRKERNPTPLKETPESEGLLENPGDGSIKQGIGMVSGWVCDAEKISVEFTRKDGRNYSNNQSFIRLNNILYGSSRIDTRETCQNNGDNGFGYLFNFALLGSGVHHADLYVDGEWQDSASVKVIVQDDKTDFVRGLTGRGTVTITPSNKTLTLKWEESTQNFQIIEVEEPAESE